ncbi:MAG TPA: DMT family transporter [Microlunatus sp.]|nr:DMT family transporter [Microlunatus sp.]
MDTTWFAVLLSLASALVGAVGTVLQQTAAAAAHDRGWRLLRRMVGRPRWLLGYGLGIVAVGLGAWALAVGALLVVQPVGVTSLLFALPLAARFYGVPMTTAQWVNAGILTLGLAAFVAIGNPSEGEAVQPLTRWLPVVVPALVVVGVLSALGRRQHGHRRALLLALGTGVMFGIQAALSKAVITLGTSGGLDLVAVITSWELYALVIMSVTSVALQQLAFQAADLSASQPAITVLTPISGAICGVAIFGERLQTSAWGWLVVVTAILAMGWATVALARTAGARPAVRPPVTTPAASH